MKFNFKNRGFVVVALSAMLIAVGVINYQLSKQSALMNKLNKKKIQKIKVIKIKITAKKRRK